ncbi:MAG TPA: hypothetical protein VHF05_01720 [Candidatus Paceibacterota bacterium]|jgi:hypothetical protein|nr:hypothetical protein [Candidatus Paceibacterota bacterium]
MIYDVIRKGIALSSQQQRRLEMSKNAKKLMSLVAIMGIVVVLSIALNSNPTNPNKSSRVVSRAAENIIATYQSLPSSEARYGLIHDKIGDVKSSSDAIALCRIIGFHRSFPDKNTKDIQLEAAKKALDLSSNDRTALLELHELVYDPSTADLRNKVLVPLDERLVALTDMKNQTQVNSLCGAWRVEESFKDVARKSRYGNQTLQRKLLDVCMGN